MHCYEVLNCDSFLNISLATILIVIDSLIDSNSEEISELYKDKVKLNLFFNYFVEKLNNEYF